MNKMKAMLFVIVMLVFGLVAPAMESTYFPDAVAGGSTFFGAANGGNFLAGQGLVPVNQKALFFRVS